VSAPKRAAPPAAAPAALYTPAWPTLAAFGLLCLWIAILSLPMWQGQFLAGPHSDQFIDGYAIRWWDAMQWRATGHIPQWNPFLFGGHPVFTGFGDLFYPSAWLRLVLPTALAMDVAFVAHYVLAGLFAYLLLRLLQVSWTGSVAGATAYQLSGVVLSLVSPGHDGKLFVTALLPLMLIALVLAIRRRRWEGHALLGVAVGLALLSPQYQMAQYALITSGLFTLYLTFGEPEGLTARERWLALAGAAGGVVLGFGISMIQILPFFHSIPYGTRAETAGYAWSTSYAMPWSHVPELALSGFMGHYGTYWGPNPLKLHSEYLGLPVLALAAVGAGSSRRRLVRWLGAIAVLFLLVSLGGATPFYHLWYALVPYVKKTRAPGMALYVTALTISCLAGLGVERLERREGKRTLQVAMAVAAVIILLAAAGVFGSIASGIAPGFGKDASAAQRGILAGALGSGLALGLLAGLAMIAARGRMPAAAFSLILIVIVGGDLYRAGRDFWQWSRPEQEQFHTDPLIEHMRQTAGPFRVIDVGAYPGNLLMRHGVPLVLGYSGVELGAYDDLLGGRNEWRNLQRVNLWDLLGVRYFISTDTVSIPGYHRSLGPVTTAAGQTAYLYEADSAPPYARVVPAAVKAESEQVVPTLIDPRLEYGRLILFDQTQPVNPEPVKTMPPRSNSRVTIAHWEPGRMSLTLDAAPAADGYVLIAENWYPDWHATVDGTAAPVLRGDATLLTIPVKSGATRVELQFDSRDYHRGQLATIVSLLLLAAWAGAAVAWRRKVQRG